MLKEVRTDVPPSNIYNIDGTSFCLDPSKTKVVGQKGISVHRTTSSETGKENITVLLGENAAGEKLPPFIVFKGKNLWDTWIPGDGQHFPGMAHAATKNGWMEGVTISVAKRGPLS